MSTKKASLTGIQENIYLCIDTETVVADSQETLH